MNTRAAREAREARAEALHALGTGRLSLKDVLRDGHEALDSCPVHKVLEATRGLGPESTRKILERKAIWPLTPMRDLSKAELRIIRFVLPKRIT